MSTEMKYPDHQYHSIDAKLQHEHQVAAVKNAIFCPTVFTQSEAKKISDDLASPDKAANDRAWSHITKSIFATDAVRLGREPDVVKRSKTVTSTILPVQPTTVVNFMSYGDENEVDMEWMRVFASDPLTSDLAASVVDVKNLIEWHDLDDDTSTIPESPLSASIWENYRPKYKGAKVLISRTKLKKDPMNVLNFIVMGIRYKAEIKKSRDAYTTIQAAILAANTAGYTTSFTTTLPITLNAAALALRLRNSDKGYGMSRNTSMLLLSYEGFISAIEAAFVQTNSIQFGTQQVQYPIGRAYTLNLSATLGISGTKAVMVLPFRKNRFGVFDAETMENQLLLENNAQAFYGRMAYNFIADPSQFQIVNLS